MTIQALYDALEARIPKNLSCPWDNDGLSVCADPQALVSGVVVALDLTNEVIERAKAEGANVIITHHPLLFHGIKVAVYDPMDVCADKVITLIKEGISSMAFHTRLDTLDGGVNDTLAELLELENILGFGDDDNPCSKPMGRMGELPAPMKLQDFVAFVKTRLGAHGVTFTGCNHDIKRVAVLGGSGGDEIYTAVRLGADALVTGDAKHHQMCDALDFGVSLIAAGHDSTEYPVCAVLAMMVSEIFTMASERIPVTLVPRTPIQTF